MAVTWLAIPWNLSGGAEDMILDLPTGIANGDLGVIVTSYNPTSGGTNVITTPAGWTLLETLTQSTTLATNVYTRTMVSSDSNGDASIPQTSSSGKYSACGVIIKGVQASVLTRSTVANSASSTTHTTPVVTGTPPRVTLSLFGTRGGGSVTTITPPAGMTEVETALGTGAATTANSIAINTTEDMDGTVGGGNWVINAAQASTVVTFALAPVVTAAPKPKILISGVETVATWSVIINGVETPITSWAVIQNSQETPLTN